MLTLRKIFLSLYYRFELIRQKKIDRLLRKRKTVVHNGQKITFFTPNAITKYRAKTFSTKEPETLDWIDSFDENAVMWDIGANIGIYSIYAAKVKNVKVFAFEPSVFNLEFLAKNIYVNDLSTQIFIMPVALSNQSGFNLFKDRKSVV